MKRQNNKTICAIICEYNPMHTGHVFLINEAKKLTGCDYMVGLMSGNFSQRSEPCILDKFSRAEIACKNGLDLVLNLPTIFCTNNAEIFALSSIKILNNLNINFLAFGVETLNEESFFELAKFLNNEPKKFKTLLKQNLKKGKNYKQTLNETLIKYKENFSKNLQENLEDILTKSNNILALEYVKSLLKTKSRIKPIFIKRVDNYINKKVIENFASSTKIREEILNNKIENIKEFLPQNSLNYFENISINFELFYNLILYEIKTKNLNDLKQIYSVNEGLENKLKLEASKTNDYNEFIKNLNSKRYKQNKINAILLNSLLGITHKLVNKIYTTKTNIYVKILAKNKQNTDILSVINTKNLIIRKNDINKIKYNSFNKHIYLVENKANSVYNLIAKTHMLENDIYNKMK